MVHPVKVGVAAFLILCTFAQGAPTGSTSARLRRNRVNGRRMKFKSFNRQLAVYEYEPRPFVLAQIATIAGKHVPSELQDTLDELFLPPGHLNEKYITIARDYHSCVFERLKSLFKSISASVEEDPSNHRFMVARPLVRDFLLLFHTLDQEYYRVTSAHQVKTKTGLPNDSGMSFEPLGKDDSDKLVGELKPLMKGVFARKDIFSPPVVESANNDNNANQDYDASIGCCDQSAHIPSVYLAQSREQELEFSIGWPHTKRGKGATLHIEEPSPLALSYSNWHHPDISSQSYDKGKGPMYPGGSTDLYPTQHAQGGSDGGSAHSESGSREASEGQHLL
ncbi:hypothetical protein SeLEV6574_g07749 [Synchytrium endobioticum]|nr:hypothetical protein SeLEV6574_g07749 [Synchytrium endobioticum]